MPLRLRVQSAFVKTWQVTWNPRPPSKGVQKFYFRKLISTLPSVQNVSNICAGQLYLNICGAHFFSQIGMELSIMVHNYA
jgi:hypothetical protein